MEILLSQVMDITPEILYNLVDMARVEFNGERLFTEKPEKMTRNGNEIYLGKYLIGWVVAIPVGVTTCRVEITAPGRFPVVEMERIRDFILEIREEPLDQVAAPGKQKLGGHWKYDFEKRREIVAKYHKDWAEGRIYNQDAYAGSYGISGKTLRSYIREFEAET